MEQPHRKSENRWESKGRFGAPNVVRSMFEEFMEIADPEEREFLSAVLSDYLEIRGEGDRDWLEAIQTAFNQNLGDDSRLLRVPPDKIPDVLAYLRWTESAE